MSGIFTSSGWALQSQSVRGEDPGHFRHCSAENSGEAEVGGNSILHFFLVPRNFRPALWVENIRPLPLSRGRIVPNPGC